MPTSVLFRNVKICSVGGQHVWSVRLIGLFIVRKNMRCDVFVLFSHNNHRWSNYLISILARAAEHQEHSWLNTEHYHIFISLFRGNFLTANLILLALFQPNPVLRRCERSAYHITIIFHFNNFASLSWQHVFYNSIEQFHSSPSSLSLQPSN